MRRNNNPVPFSTGMKTAIQATTGESIYGAQDMSSERRLASVSTITTDGSVTRNWNKFGQLANQTNYTAPSYYSPFTTPSSFQIPNNRKECYLWAQWWYDNEPKVAAGIDFYRDFPMSGFTLECSNSYVKDYYEKLVKKLNFAKWIPHLAHEYYLRGDVFPLASLDCQECHGNGDWRDDDDKPCEHEGATWHTLDILDPNMIDITPGFFGQDSNYFYVPTDDMKKVVQEQKPKELFECIPEAVKVACMQNKPIKLDPVSIWHFKHGSSPFSPFGTSLLRRLFPTLAYKDKLRQAQWLIAERHILPIKLIKVGTNERPANDSDIQAVQEAFTNTSQDPLLTVVTHHGIEVDYVGASGKVLQLTNEYELINQDIIDGLMLNKAIINGEGPAYGAAQVGLIAMAQRLEGIRREVAYWIEERLFKPIAKWNGFTAEGKRGQEELIYPTVKWDDLQLRDDSQKLQLILQLMQAGIVSSETMIELLDLNYDQEVERLRFEQDATRVNNPALSAPSMGGGFGGPMAGGMPGAMPGAPPGGMPPAGGGPSGAPVGMPMPPAMASVDDPEQAYREAARVLHEVYGRQVHASTEAMNIRLASKKVISVAHRGFLESERIPSGRGWAGELPLELENVFPLQETMDVCGGLGSVPLNRFAAYEWNNYYGNFKPVNEEEIELSVDGKVSADNLIKSIVAAKQKQVLPPPTLFTKLEQQLYNLVLGCNIPYAFYAQYSAGPTFEYQLDGAFPALKLGIEADSETFHSSPDKIAKDRRRDMELMSQGWTILRFTDQELERHPQEVVNVILTTLRKLAGGKSGDKGEVKL